MIDFTLESHIDRPPSEVFDHVSDPGRLATWQTNTVSAVQETSGPFGVGTRLREVHRAPGGKELESVVEVSEFEHHFGAYGQLSGGMRLVQPFIGRVLKRQFTEQLATLERVLVS